MLSSTLVEHKVWTLAPFCMHCDLFDHQNAFFFLLVLWKILMSSTGDCINHMHLNFIQNHFGCSERCSDSGSNQPQEFKLGCHEWCWIMCFLVFQIAIFCVSTLLPWGMAVHVKTVLHLNFHWELCFEYVRNYLLPSALQMGLWASQNECPKLVEASDLDLLAAVLWKWWQGPAAP